MSERRVSAAELRAMGFTVPESIPDVATVPFSAIKMSSVESDAGGALNVTVRFEVDAPWEWVELDLTVKSKEDTH